VLQLALQPSSGDTRVGISFLNRAGLRTGLIYVIEDGDMILGRDQAGQIRFFSNGIERLTIDGAGKIGIGTTNPTQALSVNGTVRAKEVLVDTDWSDYVFTDGYRLASLAEVESHIKAEGHLPGIPSAQNVAEHGVSVGEMQSKLLAKIEELTLHAIEQDKHQIAHEKRLSEQSMLLVEQSARLEQLEQENALLRQKR
jgi:hypothetical protein